jgi:hypothetical protein
VTSSSSAIREGFEDQETDPSIHPFPLPAEGNGNRVNHRIGHRNTD